MLKKCKATRPQALLYLIEHSSHKSEWTILNKIYSFKLNYIQMNFIQMNSIQMNSIHSNLFYQNVFHKNVNVNLTKVPSKSTVLHRWEGDHEIKFYIFEKVVWKFIGCKSRNFWMFVVDLDIVKRGHVTRPQGYENGFNPRRLRTDDQHFLILNLKHYHYH